MVVVQVDVIVLYLLLAIVSAHWNDIACQFGFDNMSNIYWTARARYPQLPSPVLIRANLLYLYHSCSALIFTVRDYCYSSAIWSFTLPVPNIGHLLSCLVEASGLNWWLAGSHILVCFTTSSSYHLQATRNIVNIDITQHFIPIQFNAIIAIWTWIHDIIMIS